MLNQRDSMPKREPQFQNWGLEDVKTQWDEDREELVIESSIETIGSWGFGTDELVVFTGMTEDIPPLGFVLKEEELLQNEDEQLKEDETVMSHVQKFVVVGGREELACLRGQEKLVGHIFETATIVEDQSFTLIEDEDAVLGELEVIQEEGRQLLKIAQEEEEEHAEFKLQHADDVKQVKNEWLNCL